LTSSGRVTFSFLDGSIGAATPFFSEDRYEKAFWIDDVRCGRIRFGLWRHEEDEDDRQKD